MSKTYFSKHDFNKPFDDEFKQQAEHCKAYGCPHISRTKKEDAYLHNELKESNPEEFEKLQAEYYKDWEKFSHMQNGMCTHLNVKQRFKCSRHPNGTKGHGLGKGLLHDIRSFRDRFDEAQFKSSNLHKEKHAGTHERRRKQDRELREIINNIDES